MGNAIGPIITIGATTIGSFFGYPGMMIGLTLGSWLAGKFANNHSPNNNSELKNTNTMTKIDFVPYVIGTAMAPGQVIWFGQLSLMDSATLRASEAFDAGSAYFSSYYRPLNSKFAVAFAMKKSPSNYISDIPYINRVFFDGKDQWNWCLWMADLVHWDYCKNHNTLEGPWVIDYRVNTFGSGNDYLLTGIPHKHFSFLSYDGWFGDFSTFEVMDNEDIVDSTSDNDFNFREAIAIQRFPDVTAEVSEYRVPFVHEGFRNYTSPYSSERHSSRDGIHDYYYKIYGVWNYGVSPYVYEERFVRIHPFYGNEIIIDYPNFYNSYCKGSNYEMELSRTDESLDRLYFVKGRIHNGNSWDWPDWCTHYAKYSLAYDLFYVDRQTLEVHSLKLDEKIYLSNYEGPASTINLRSMEIVDNYILLFGWMAQDAFPLIYDVIATSIGNSGTRVYCDLSGVPDGTFNNWYIRCNGNNNVYAKTTPLRKITNQTTTYVDIDKKFGLADADMVGTLFHIQYAMTDEMDFVVSDIGSTTTKIICNCPYAHATIGAGDLEVGQFYNVRYAYSNSNYEYRIDWDRTTIGGNIYLLDPLPTAPFPGTVFYVDFEAYYPSNQTPLDSNVYNPVLPSRMQNRYDDTWELLWGGTVTELRWNNVIAGCNNVNRFVCLKINKSTGAFEGLLEDACHLVRHDYAWGDALQYTTSPTDSVIITCATDKEVFVHCACMQTGSIGAVLEFKINSQTLNCTSAIWESNPYSQSHAYGRFPVATSWIWSYDSSTLNWKKMWYSLWFDYTTYTIFFAKMSNGSFSNLKKMLIRKVMYSGPLYAAWWALGSTFRESQFIAKLGLENKLYLSFNHAWDGGNYSFGGANETWVVEAPTADHPKGNFRCLDQGTNWTCHTYKITGFDCFISSLSVVIAGWWSNLDCTAHGYHCDANPVEAIFRVLQYNDDFGGHYHMPSAYWVSYASEVINQLFENSSYFYSYDAALLYCNEFVMANVYINDKLIYFKEPRYAYSECITSAKPFVDIVKDIMQTTMGWMVPCGGKLKFVVPKKDETAELYFGYEENDYSLTQQINIPAYPSSGAYVTSDYYDSNKLWMKLNLNITGYPLNYFLGHSGSFTFLGYTYEFIITEHSVNNQIKVYFIDTRSFSIDGSAAKLCRDAYYDGLNFSGITVTIDRKDNIKEHSFTYAQKSKQRLPNVVRIEYENRTNEYVVDIAEATSGALRLNDGYDKIQTYEMKGIKRATQANRVALQMMDYLEFVEWMCSFETDVMGTQLCAGSIIGVSHPITGWDKKLFRIMSMEEAGEDFNVKLELEEYIPDVYHDIGEPPIITSAMGSYGIPTGSWNSNAMPVEDFNFLEDQTFPYLYIGFRSSDMDTNVIGIRVYRLVGSNWILEGTILGIPTTMELVGSLTGSEFDNQYITYTNISGGSVPESGAVWIGNELISYNGVDEENLRLMNLVRGVNDTPIEVHSAGSLITVWGTASYIEFPSDWIGSQTFKLVPFTYGGSVSTGDLGSAPSKEVTIIGSGYKPYPPETLRLSEVRV